MRFLFFSAESEPPAGYLIMKMLNPIEAEFNRLHFSQEYCNAIGNICIVYICISESLEKQGFGKERKYISHKKRYADYRIRIPYDTFLKSNHTEKMHMCLNTITHVAYDIKRKIPSFNADKFVDDISNIFEKEFSK